MYANDNGGLMPSWWLDLTNQLSVLTLLYCPADTAHPAQSNWANVNFSAISYEIVSPGVSDWPPDVVFARCLVHSNVVCVDGTAREVLQYEGSFPAAPENGIYLNGPALAKGKEKAEQIDCINHCKQIGLAARIYANDNNGLAPSSFSQLTNELYAPGVLFCPSDKTNPSPASFSQVDYRGVSYEIVNTDALGYPSMVYARCRLHDNLLYGDGSVAEGTNLSRLIVGDPLSQTVEPGQAVTLRVLPGSNHSGFRYQWRKKEPIDLDGYPFTNTVNIAGATNSTLEIGCARAIDEGYYDVLVADTQGHYQVSYMAYLRVEPLANIRSAFSLETISCFNNLRQIGLAALLDASQNSTEVLPGDYDALIKYLGWPMCLYCPSDLTRTVPETWDQFDRNTSYVLNSGVSETDSTNMFASCKIHGYYVQADGGLFPKVSPPSITAQPQSQTVIPGTNVTLSVTASGTNLLYHWRKDESFLLGATNATLNWPRIQDTDAGRYDVVVSNNYGAVTSAWALVSLSYPPPRISSFGIDWMEVQAETGKGYRVQASCDLNNWTTVAGFTNTEPTVRLDLPGRSTTNRFYRVRSIY